MDQNQRDSIKKMARAIPIAVWAFFALVAGASSINELDVFHIIAGLGSMAGTGFVVYKFIKKEMEE